MRKGFMPVVAVPIRPARGRVWDGLGRRLSARASPARAVRDRRMCRAPEDSLQKLDDLCTRQRLIFEETLGKSFEIFAFFGDDPCRFGEARFHQTAHFGVDFLLGGL